MKRLITVILILILIILGLGIFVKPALMRLAAKMLEKAFQTNDIHIGTFHFTFLRQLAFSDIQIKKLDSFDIRLRQASITYSLASLLNRKILKLKLEEVSFGHLTLKELELSDIRLALGKVRVSGYLSIPQIKYQKAQIGPIHAKLKIEDKVLHLDPLTAQIYDGEMKAGITLNLDKEMVYQAVLNFMGVDIDRFIRDFDLEERFQMTGTLGGEVSLSGSGATIQAIKGDLATSQPGGKLTITDQRFLENLARTSQQSLDILVESFKNYYYNMGIVQLRMDQGNLVLDVNLDGEAGKRNLSIVVHDFN